MKVWIGFGGLVGNFAFFLEGFEPETTDLLPRAQGGPW